MRQAVAEHHPSILRPTLSRPGARDVDDLVVAVADAILRAEDGHGAAAGFEGEDAALRARGVFQAAEGEEENRAEGDPERRQSEEAPKHVRYHKVVTRQEIEQKLIAIVQQEKNVTAEQLRPETLLEEAGIDSLDSLTILFAIEEEFRISIPDPKARALRTFGDMIDVVEELV